MRKLRANTQIKLPGMITTQLGGKLMVIPSLDHSPTRIGKASIILHLKENFLARTHTLYKGRGRIFTTNEYKAYVEQLRWLILKEIREKLDDSETVYGIRCRFFLPSGGRSGDIDNLTKPIIDAGTGLIWHDDSQIWELNVNLVRGHEEIYTELLIYTIMQISPKIHNLCLFCGKPFEHWPGEGRSKYCSFACYKAHLQQPKICDYCGKRFTTPRVRGYRHIFCSLECNYAYRREHPQEYKSADGKFHAYIR